jgi:flavin reductase (DIM6/NTAB) family NADH-FMN oxidoreductase RutF
MKKINLGSKPILYPMPVVLVGAHVDNKPAFMTAAYCGIINSDPAMISVSIRPSRFTGKGIRQNNHFSINIPTTSMAKEVDYCGVYSGSKVDKVAACKFDLFYGHLTAAPMINQCPVNLCCTVSQVIELGTHELFLGRIDEAYISDDCMTDEKPDIQKIKPLAFITGTEGGYAAIGKIISPAFKPGLEPKK